ncbi:MAG: MotA/TolQ/ExbB proton channel family protein [Chryseolinea sp.]
MMLLQIVSDAAIEKETVSGSSLSLIDLIQLGGIMMIPIILLFFLELYLIIDRVRFTHKADTDHEGFVARVKELILNGDMNGAKVFCDELNSPMSRVVEKGINRIGNPLPVIEAAMQNIARIELFNLERNLGLLSTISGAAPMLGFLGTVLGIAKSFMAISADNGTLSPGMMTSGIFSAMISTIAGLIVGIIAYLAYQYFVSVVQKIANRIEQTTVDFIDLLQEHR